MPALRDEAEEAADEEAAHEAAVEESFLERRLVVGAAAQFDEDPKDVQQDEQVQDPDDPEERARHARADRAAPVLEAGQVCVDGSRRDREARREREDDRRVSK